MKYTITSPANALFDNSNWASLKRRLKVDDTMREEVLELAAECVAHAEQKMECSLIQREITAQYWLDDLLNTQDCPYYIPVWGYQFALPRGPVIGDEYTDGILSVTDANGHALTHKLYTVGNSDRVYVQSMTTAFPITVVYQAGYGTADKVPADILRVIKVHILTTFDLRGEFSTLSLTPVQSVDQFYEQRGRGIPIA